MLQRYIKTKAVCSCGTLITTYKTTQCHNLGDHNPKLEIMDCIFFVKIIPQSFLTSPYLKEFYTKYVGFIRMPHDTRYHETAGNACSWQQIYLVCRKRNPTTLCWLAHSFSIMSIWASYKNMSYMM